MTRKVFWEDPYLKQLSTRIAGVDGNTVTVDETIFFAFSGGQESDAGTIGDRPVEEARLADGQIYYTLPDGHGLAAGAPVLIKIDWERRYRLMRLHFAAELILELVVRHQPSIEKIGAHIAADKARIDFKWDRNIGEIFEPILKQAAAIVAADHAITSAFSDEAAERRYWKIPDFAAVPCGGTHLRSTGEIGAIRLKRKNIGKSKERIEIRLEG